MTSPENPYAAREAKYRERKADLINALIESDHDPEVQWMKNNPVGGVGLLDHFEVRCRQCGKLYLGPAHRIGGLSPRRPCNA
ncbi:MAG: hypothetical protein ACR2N7_12680 [Acidimicrobiia bacterium]